MAGIKIHALEKWRRSKGMTQTDVAQKIYCCAATICNAENYRPVRLKYVKRLVSVAMGALKESDFAINLGLEQPKVRIGKTQIRKRRRKRRPLSELYAARARQAEADKPKLP